MLFIQVGFTCYIKSISLCYNYHQQVKIDIRVIMPFECSKNRMAALLCQWIIGIPYANVHEIKLIFIASSVVQHATLKIKKPKRFAIKCLPSLGAEGRWWSIKQNSERNLTIKRIVEKQTWLTLSHLGKVLMKTKSSPFYLTDETFRIIVDVAWQIFRFFI